MSDFLGALAATREAFRQDEYIHRVKSLIREKICELDKDAVVEDTHYFNHSAIPDFVVTWSGQKLGRDFYLRGSYASIIAAEDVGSTASGDPVFLSLDANKDFESEFPPISPEMIRAEPTKSSYTLLTDVNAMNEILQPPSPKDSSPLSTLVKASFIRGGRGLIDEERAETLVTTEKRDDDRPDLLEVVRESFSESAATKMERTAAIIDLALETQTKDKGPEFNLERLTGRLSDTELHAILPWLLNQDGVTRDLAFWRRLGDMTSLRDIESIADELEGLNLDLLVKANAGIWRAKRTYLGISRSIATEGDQKGTGNEVTSASLGWSFQSGNLTLDNGTHRVLYSSDGRSLPGRDESRIPGWEEVKEQLSDFRLSSVNLRGITRSVRIDAERSDDIRQDVEDVAVSLDDTYSVSEVALQFAPRDTPSGTAAVSIRFGKGLTATDGGATLEDLTRSSLQVLAYKAPVSAEDVDLLLNPASVAASSPTDPDLGLEGLLRDY